MLQFGPFALDLDRATLIRDGAELPLRPKCFDVLRFLVENPGRLVSKEELLAAVWPGVVVTDSSLPQCMVEVRRALGEVAREMIITVPRRGYRLEAAVRSVNGSFTTNAASGVGRRIRAASVLAMAAAALLIVAGMFPLERFIAGSAQTEARQLEGSAPGQEEQVPESSVAYGQYVRGQMFQDRRAKGDLQRSIEYFRRAVKLDPGFAQAWVGLAGSIWLDARTRGDRDFATWGAEYKAVLDRALEIEPEHAEAHARLANYFRASGEIELAEKHFDRALRAGSDSSLILDMAAWVAFWQGDPQRAVDLARRAAEMEPLSVVRQSNYAAYLFYSGNLALARKHLEITLDLNPAPDKVVEGLLMQTLVLQGDFSAAVGVANNLPEGSLREQGLALFHESIGDLPARDRHLRKLESSTSADAALRLAEVYAYLDQPESTGFWLESALHRKAAEADESCIRQFVLEATLSPFLAGLSAESLVPIPIAREVARQLSNHQCPPS